MISDVGITSLCDFRRGDDVHRLPGGAAVVPGAVAVVDPLLPDAGHHGSWHHLLHHRNHHHRLHRRAPGPEEEAGGDVSGGVCGLLPARATPHRSGITAVETEGWMNGMKGLYGLFVDVLSDEQKVFCWRVIRLTEILVYVLSDGCRVSRWCVVRWTEGFCWCVVRWTEGFCWCFMRWTVGCLLVWCEVGRGILLVCCEVDRRLLLMCYEMDRGILLVCCETDGVVVVVVVVFCSLVRRVEVYLRVL